MAARANALVSLPESLSFEDGAAISCGVGTAYTALCRLGISGRDTLAIFGQGPVGLSATMLAAAMGAEIIACEMSDERLRLAVSAGAVHAVDAGAVDPPDAIAAITGGRGVDAALDCSGSPTGRVAAIRATRARGQVCFVGVGPPTAFDVSEEIIGKELTCYGSWTFTAPGLIRCMDFVSRHSCQLSQLISHRSAIDDAAEVFAAFDSGSTGKCMLVF
jgi:threonine dehydrogenase-like Zn-dependent dehydrogenase